MLSVLRTLPRALSAQKLCYLPGRHRRLSCAYTSVTCQSLEDCLVLNYGGTSMRFNYVWLRDHCRSAASYYSNTNQRTIDTGSIDLSIRPVDTAVQDDHLILTWPGGQESKYSLSWLAENSYETKKQSLVQPRILWNADIYKKANIPSAKWDKFMSSDEELKKFLKNYLLYGIAVIDNVPATVEDSKAVAKRISLMRETTFGQHWCVTSTFSRADTSYSYMAIEHHTDTTFLQEPTGIQVFHCLKREGTGGRTILVDGFYAAEKVRERSPENFELLSHLSIRHKFIENSRSHKVHLEGIGPVLNVYPWNNELYLIQYNNSRKMINTIPHYHLQQWYVALRDLTTELRRPENELLVELTPGKMVFLDNWRVMHGRESFTGQRELWGCYLTRDDILSSARCFGLQA